MKPWEDEKTVQQFRRMSGTKSAKIGFDLTDSALHILISGIRAKQPKIRKKEFAKKIEHCIWG